MSGAARQGTGAAWEVTAQLRNQFFRTTFEAMPTRIAEASAELQGIRTKIAARDVTVNEIGIGALRAVELYAFYLLGRVIGSRSLS
jgi:hypothetical protein